MFDKQPRISAKPVKEITNWILSHEVPNKSACCVKTIHSHGSTNFLSDVTAHGGPKSFDTEINHIIFLESNGFVNKINKADERANKGMSHWHQSVIVTIDTYRAEYFLLGIVSHSEAQAAGVLLINLALATFGFCSAPSAQGCFRTV